MFIFFSFFFLSLFFSFFFNNYNKVFFLFSLLIVYCYIIIICINYLEFVFWFDGVIFFEYDFVFYNGALDSLSLFLLFLTIFVYILTIIFVWNLKKFFFYFILLNLLFIFLFNVFFVNNLLLFYFFFEATLIPMYIMIGFLGTRLRKITAAYRFFLYTFFGSIFFFVVLFIIFFRYGTFNFFFY